MSKSLIDNLIYQSKTALDRNQASKAEELCKRALAINPDEKAAMNNLGLAYLQMHQLDQAEQVLGSCLQLDPNYGFARKNIAKVYVAKAEALYDLGSFDEASKAAEQARQFPETPSANTALLVMGLALEQLGKPDEALEYLRRAYTASPQLSAAKTNFQRLQRAIKGGEGQQESTKIPLREALSMPGLRLDAKPKRSRSALLWGGAVVVAVVVVLIIYAASNGGSYGVAWQLGPTGGYQLVFNNRTQQAITLQASDIVTNAFGAALGNQEIAYPADFPMIIEPGQTMDISLAVSLQRGDNVYVSVPGFNTLKAQYP